MAGRAASRPAPTARLGPAVFALATGGFAIGTTEFVTMGLLPQVADGVAVSIPTAGHLISAYALGVVVGAPLLAFFGARLPRRGLLVGLMAAYALFNLASALSTGFVPLLVLRFLDGLPHGAYFGVASLVAAGLAAPGRQGRAVARSCSGCRWPTWWACRRRPGSASTWAGGRRSSRWRAWPCSPWCWCWPSCPRCPGDPAATGRRELGAFTRPQVWLTLLIGATGFGGIFAVYTYIAPTITDVGGLPAAAVPVFLLAFGLGMVAGTWVAGSWPTGPSSARCSGRRSGWASCCWLFAALAPHGWWALPIVFLIMAVSSVLVVNLQLRLMDVAGDAQTLGAAMNHASLNVANALGAWLGGLVIAAGFGYRSPALVGAALSAVGFLVLVVSAVLARRSRVAPS